MRLRALGPLGAALLTAIVLSGCGESDPLNRQAVSGTVTLDGAPLDQGVISFHPQDQKNTSGGATITAGKYSIAKKEGLGPGKYKVVISAGKSGTVGDTNQMPGMPMPAVERIPEEYNTNSDKSVDVSDKGPNAFNFDIVSKKK